MKVVLTIFNIFLPLEAQKTFNEVNQIRFFPYSLTSDMKKVFGFFLIHE